MIKFFRVIRQRLLTENKFSKYILYAIGEIILVVIGILIALQANNWNESRKSKNFEVKILQEIRQSLKQDLERTTNIYNWRAVRKQKAISKLIDLLNTEHQIEEKELYNNFGSAGLTLSFYFDKGPFESLKSKGFENIQNDSLRNEIIRFYEVSMPLNVIFVDNEKGAYNNYRYNLRGQFLDYSFEKSDSVWRVDRVLDMKKLRKNKKMAEWLRLEQGVSDNYIRRLERVMEKYKQMIFLVEEELSKS